MTDNIDGVTISYKIKEFLSKKLSDSHIKIKKLIQKRTVYKVLFITTASSSIIISVVLASIAGLTAPSVSYLFYQLQVEF